MVIEKIRVDKWLWAVRIFKTRSLASEMCEREKVWIEGQHVKPSREVKVGQKIKVRKDNIDWEYEILKCIDKRVSATVANECRKDITPPEIIERAKLIRSMWVPRREPGEGRPTKKERRDLDKFMDY
ncbi:MAG: RNA-binding S4 domain-containing protein [Candidatus Omnitrophica bacterium]|nr:RNA-binding S4 domain-containing protein [Candidatus Omnitrophota bacterium]